MLVCNCFTLDLEHFTSSTNNAKYGVLSMKWFRLIRVLIYCTYHAFHPCNLLSMGRARFNKSSLWPFSQFSISSKLQGWNAKKIRWISSLIYQKSHFVKRSPHWASSPIWLQIFYLDNEALQVSDRTRSNVGWQRYFPIITVLIAIIGLSRHFNNILTTQHCNCDQHTKVSIILYHINIILYYYHINILISYYIILYIICKIIYFQTKKATYLKLNVLCWHCSNLHPNE